MSQCVLVVEDDLSIQAMVQAVLEKSGYEVLAAPSGTEMFNVLKVAEVDLILLDLGLPDGDALPYIQDVRKQYDLPVVILTGRQKMDDRLMALGLGANDYLTKPIDPRELVLRIGNMLSPGGAQSRPDIPATEIPPPPSPALKEKPKRDMATIYGVIAFMLAVGIGGVWYLSPEPRSSEGQTTAVPVTTPAAEMQPATVVEAESDPDPVPVEVVPPTSGTDPEPQVVIVQPPSLQSDPVDVSAEDIQLSKAEILGYGWVLETKCQPIPDVPWWKLRTHEGIVSYVLRRHDGYWKDLEDELVKRLARMYDIAERKSGIVVQTGVTLRDEELDTYIEQFAQRLMVVRCLAKEADAAEATGAGDPG